VLPKILLSQALQPFDENLFEVEEQEHHKLEQYRQEWLFEYFPQSNKQLKSEEFLRPKLVQSKN